MALICSSPCSPKAVCAGVDYRWQTKVSPYRRGDQMIIRVHNGERQVISRAIYTRRIWKANHYVFGNWALDCWNIVYCGLRAPKYTLAHSQATVATCETMKISCAEFQFFFEKTDQGDAIVQIEQHDLRFNWKGKKYTFTRGMDKSKVIVTSQAVGSLW